MNRKIYFWKLPSTELAMGERTLIMGVLNVTPDSFSDGGRFSDPERACARALEMEEQGADIIDLGAESTRPDSKRISADEEWRRLLPVLKLLRDKLTVPLSLDTYKSEIAERAVQYGVSIFNDPSGLTFDANLAKVAAEHNAGLILNHMRGTPETWGKQTALADVIGAVSKDLEATVSRARRAGVEKNRIMVDPGLGFGKRREQNSEIIAHLGRLAELDYPILAGPSRKSFLTNALPGAAGENETLFATAAAVTAAILYGAHMVRVHDVKEMKSAAQIADEILRVAAVHRAVAEAAEDQQRPAVRPRIRPEATHLTGERATPTRPPLARPLVVPKPQDVPKPKELVDEPVEASSEVGPELPNEVVPEKPIETTPAPPPAVEKAGERPAFRRPAADRPPRRDSGDRPPRREFKPAADRPPRRDQSNGDRPPRPFADRPARPFGDRPPRPGGDRPARSGDRPPRPFGDRPPRSGGDDRRPSRPAGDRPQRPFGDRPPRPFADRPSRPGGDRPPFGDRPSRPAGDRPSRPAGDRPPRGEESPRSFRPGGDRDRPRGDRPGGNDRPPRSGPPRGGSGPGRPPGGRPPRPFRKRP